MKKLALALMCLVSVAFFASCTVENPEPAISILSGEEYIQDGAVLNLDTEYQFGFVVASNAETGKKLASLVIKVDDKEWATEDLTDKTEFTYTGMVSYTLERDSIVGESTITAVVTDEAGKINTATINVTLNQVDAPLAANPISWVRKGTNVEDATSAEMAALGLKWTGSYKEYFATIEPLDGAALYVVSGDDFATITTESEKSAYFVNLRETGTTVSKYRNITTNNSADYNDLLAVIDAAGNTHLVLIKHAEVVYTDKTTITITGETK